MSKSSKQSKSSKSEKNKDEESEDIEKSKKTSKYQNLSTEELIAKLERRDSNAEHLKKKYTKLEQECDELRMQIRRLNGRMADLESVNSNDFNKKPCKFYLQGDCRNGTNCNFLHIRSDKPSYRRRIDRKVKEDDPSTHKTQLCKYYENGNCSRSADECKFAHGEDDLKNSDAHSSNIRKYKKPAKMDDNSDDNEEPMVHNNNSEDNDD